VYIIQDWMLWTNASIASSPNKCVELNLDHMAGAHAPTFGHAVDQGLIEIDDEGLLGKPPVWRVV
jgi:hypothetical protein